MAAPAVTIIILNWNGKKFLEQFLPSVLATEYEHFTILLADNGSTDDSLAFTRAHYPSVRILELKENHGFTTGNNLALKEVDTPYFVLLNSDVEVTPGWLGPLVELMEANPKVASVQPRLRAFHNKEYFEYAGAAGGMIDKYAYPFCRGRLFDTAEKDEGQFEEATEIFWATGACCLIRKSVTDQIGLFEDEFFAHMEEIDFCWRAKNFGWQIMVEPRSTVYHVGGGTLNRTSPRKTFLNARNSLIVMIKNYPPGTAAWKTFMRACLDGIWAGRALVRFDFATIGAILKAHWSVWLRLGHWKRRKKETYAALDTIPQPGAGAYPHAIVFQYFLRGRKKVSQLKNWPTSTGKR